MFESSEVARWLAATWHVWLVTVTLMVAAIIDYRQLRVPNWLTFPMILSGLVYSATLSSCPGWEGLGYGVLGTLAGLALLLPAYAVGGMGAGDVKLLAGVGAWMWSTVTLYAFLVSTIVGAVIAVGMILWTKSWNKHFHQFWLVGYEILTIKDPEKLSELAAERKPHMFLLPYGIPIAIGSIGYFAWHGMQF